jgi:T5orf172 domain-containing protein
MSGQGDAARARMEADAFVYISASRKLGLIKIGWTKNSNRGQSMNKDGYGGATDWVLLYERKFKRSGWVESNAHKCLNAFRVPEDYIRLGHGYSVKAKELFVCNYSDAYEAVERTTEQRLSDEYVWPREDVGNFNFRI